MFLNLSFFPQNTVNISIALQIGTINISKYSNSKCKFTQTLAFLLDNTKLLQHK